MVLKLVDVNCDPISGADIEVWFCNREGIYSGDTSETSDASSFNSGFCTGSDNEALNSRWFRGVQTTDENGLVNFKACFPGWYPGRTTHIHFRVIDGGRESLVSQFCFDDDIANDIYVNHDDYTGQEKDTTNAGDNVFDSDFDAYVMEVERQSDNSMVAYKAIQLS